MVQKSGDRPVEFGLCHLQDVHRFSRSEVLSGFRKTKHHFWKNCLAKKTPENDGFCSPWVYRIRMFFFLMFILGGEIGVEFVGDPNGRRFFFRGRFWSGLDLWFFCLVILRH